MKKRLLRAVVPGLLVLAFCAGASGALQRAAAQEGAAAARAEAAALAAEPSAFAETPRSAGKTDTYSAMQTPFSMDISALQAVNSEVIGWLLIPGTELSQPVLQGKDNTFYLDHNWKLGHSDEGAVFMEWENSADFSDFNTILYGHNMRNGSMFALLHSYADPAFGKAHPDIYIVDGSGTRRYTVFAAFEAQVPGITYALGIRETADKLAFLRHSRARTVLDASAFPTVHDHILTLSTCTGRGYTTRWVVQAVLAESWPAEG